MKEFYAEECSRDYGELCWEEQTRQSVTLESLKEILNVEVVEYWIDFNKEIIEYEYIIGCEFFVEEISINDFFKKAYELEDSKSDTND